MEYTCRMDIAVPRARVIELMTDGDRAGEWMPGLVSYVATVGERGEEGSTSQLDFVGMPGSDEAQSMLEKVERRDDAHYDTVYLLGPVRNEAFNTFTDVDGGTHWEAHHVFHLPPGMREGMGPGGAEGLRANTQRSMETFKQWCEANA